MHQEIAREVVAHLAVESRQCTTRISERFDSGPTEMRALLAEFEAIRIEDNDQAADKVSAVICYLDDGNRDERSTLPEDNSILAILYDVVTYLSRSGSASIFLILLNI